VRFSRPLLLPLLYLCLFIGGCASYKQNVILKSPEDFKGQALTTEVVQAERNYIIQRSDLLKLEVYSNKGERLVDPNPEVSRPTANSANQSRPPANYLVDLNGIVKYPIVGDLKMEGLTLRQAEAILQREYEKYFTDSFVVLTFQNKRVILLGAVGGQVIPLVNPNTTLAEILALAKGLGNDSKAQNIRVVRGNQVFIIDLSTIASFQAGNMIVEPGDIIYVEPVRRPFAEGLRDYTGIISLFVSALSLIIVLRSVN
jgi:polysaccharide biosynthesis/export protein